MASRTLDVTLNAKDNMSATFDKAGNAAEQMGDALESAGERGGRSLTQMGTALQSIGTRMAAFGAAGVAAFGLAARGSMQLETAMANVQSIARVSEGELAGLTDQVRSLAVELGSSPTDLANGLYDIVSSGVPAAQAMQVLETSAVAARAGLTSTATSARAITAVLNAYSLEATEAGNVSDLLFKTVDSGVLTFDQLANNLGQVLPLASQLNVSFEEVSAALAEMTLQGINAAQAETALAALMTATLRETEAMSEALEAYGAESAEAIIQSEGLVGLLEFLAEASGGSSAALLELLGSSEAARAALALMRNDGEDFNAMLAEMEGAAQDGAYSLGVFEIQSQTTAFAIDRARAALSDFGLTVGNAISPTIETAANAITGFANILRDLPDPLVSIAAQAGLAVSAINLLGGGLLIGAGRLLSMSNALATARAAITSWQFAVTAAVGAAVIWYSTLDEGESAWDRFDAAMSRLVEADTEGWFESIADSVQIFIRGVNEAQVETAGLTETLAELQATALETSNQNLAIFENMNAGVAQHADAVYEGSRNVIDGLTRQELAQRQAAESGREYEDVLKELGEAYRLDTEEAGAFNEAVRTIGDALLDPSTNAKALIDDLTDLRNEMISGRITYDEYAEGVIAVSEDLHRYTGEALDAATAGATLGGILADQTGELEANATAAAKLREEQQQLREEWIAGSEAIAGWDNALAQVNMAGFASDASLFASAITRSATALDNTFRIIVSNVEGIAGSVEQVMTTLNDLFALNDEGWSRMDELLNTGEIGWGEYTAAQTAAAEATASHSIAQRAMTEIIARQAPFLADMSAATTRWLSDLADMPLHVQRTTLAFMDMQTVQQANELVTLANSEAFQLLGENGQAAFEATIQGALQVNPLLFDVLESMGIINGTPLNFTVDYSALEAAQSPLEQLTENVGNLVDTLRLIYNLSPLSVDVETSAVESAAETVEFLYEQVANADGTVAYLITRVDVEGEEQVDEIIDSVENADGTYNVIVEAENGETYEAVLAQDGTVISTTYVDVIPRLAQIGGAIGGTVTSLLEGLGIPETIERTVDVSVTGGDEIAAVEEAVSGLEDKTVTISVDADASAIGNVLDLVGQINELGAATVSVTFEADTSAVTSAIALMSGAAGGGGGNVGGFEAPSITVDFIANTQPVADALNAIRGGSANPEASAAATITVDFIADTSAVQLEALDLPDDIEVQVAVSTTGVLETVAQLAGVTLAALAIPESESVGVTAPGAEGAANSLDGVTSAANAIPESESVSVSVSGAAAAVSALNSVANAAAAIPSSVSTTITTNRVTNNISTFSTIGTAPFAHGGIAGYANGGVVIRAGEVGSEIAHFPSGGMALLPSDGLYAVPPNTYISPHNTYDSRSFGPMVDFSGATFIGTNRAEMNAWAEDTLVPMLNKSLDDRQRGYGGGR